MLCSQSIQDINHDDTNENHLGPLLYQSNLLLDLSRTNQLRVELRQRPRLSTSRILELCCVYHHEPNCLQGSMGHSHS